VEGRGLVDNALVVAKGLTPDLDQGETHLPTGVLIRLWGTTLEDNLNETSNSKCVYLLGCRCDVESSSIIIRLSIDLPCPSIVYIYETSA
jgi:hypothetical protein